MRVAIELYPGFGRSLQRVDSLSQRLHIDVFIGCGAMHANQTLAYCHRAARQIAQPFAARARELRMCPLRSVPRNWIEVVQTHEPATGAVMIAAHIHAV